MPLIVLCGYPCSGKSRIAERIAKAIREDGGNVVTISEESMHLGRNARYKGIKLVIASLLSVKADLNHLLKSF
jgi:tRNA uridine 5-carbamoylmethylation protein Kti12